MLAGVSADYYARLEQGRDRHPSAEVLAALGRVLTLDEDALVHLRQLAAAAPASSRVLAGTRPVGSGVLQLLSQWEHTPAFVLDPFRDVLACTPLAAALHPGLCQRPNMIRLMFLDETEQAMHPNWERSARDAVAALRASAGPYMDDPRLASLVGELGAREHRVRPHVGPPGRTDEDRWLEGPAAPHRRRPYRPVRDVRDHGQPRPQPGRLPRRPQLPRRRSPLTPCRPRHI